MNPLILAILAIVGVGAAGFALVPVAARRAAAPTSACKALQGDIQANRRESRRRPQSARPAARKSSRRCKQQTDALDKRKKRVPLQDQIFQAGMKIKQRDFIRNQVIVGVVVFVDLLRAAGADALLRSSSASPPATCCRGCISAARRKKYQNKFLDELPNAVEAIVRGVKSGLPLNDSMRARRQGSQGAGQVRVPARPRPAVGRQVDDRGGARSCSIACRCRRSTSSSSSSPCSSRPAATSPKRWATCRRVLRNRKKMKQKIKAMSSEAKASAGIIGSLPFIVAHPRVADHARLPAAAHRDPDRQ